MRLLLVCIAALCLAGCAGLSSNVPIDSSVQLGPPLERFSAEGRISLRQGERRDHLRFRWEHAPGRDSVLLMSPLGQGMAELSRDAEGARLIQPGKQTLAASDLRQLAQDVFGTPLPLEALADWLRGAQPALHGEVDGWRVTVSDTSPYRQRRLLRVLDATRDDVELKLIVDDWESDD